MIKTWCTYALQLMLLMVMCSACNKGRQMPSLKESYAKADPEPFGTAVAYRLVGQLFARNEVKVKKANFAAVLANSTDTGAGLISITRSFQISEDERTALLSFIEKGNTVFIASEYFDSAFIRELSLPLQKPVTILEDVNALNTTGVGFSRWYINDSSKYNYYYIPLHHAFDTGGATAMLQPLGSNELNHPNFILSYYGKGKVMLHCEPRVFSNYFLLQRDNYRYLQQALSFMPPTPEHLFWDDYHHNHFSHGSKQTKSGLAMLLEFPAMGWAFWLTLLLLALYLLFGSKRRQRIVPPIAPNVNNTVAFTETVSRLYLQYKDNRNIAEKIITYFLEHIRTTYFLNTSTLNDDFAESLGRKTAMPLEEAKRLVHLMQKIQTSHHQLPDQQLLALNALVEKFYKTKS